MTCPSQMGLFMVILREVVLCIWMEHQVTWVQLWHSIEKTLVALQLPTQVPRELGNREAHLT